MATPRRSPCRRAHRTSGHAAFFLVFALGTVTMVQLAAVGIAHLLPAYHALPMHDLALLPKVTILSSFIAYLLVIGLAILFFPTVWHRSFAGGISWNLDAAKQNWKRLIPLGIASLSERCGRVLLSIPKDLPVDKFFFPPRRSLARDDPRHAACAAFEEICFRGFLLPAIAIAWDWCTLPRTPEAGLQWRATNTLSPVGLAVRCDHHQHRLRLDARQAAQLHAGPTGSSLLHQLALSAVRIRFRSVAASSLVHASYNGLLFLVTFIQTSGYTHLDKMPR